VAEIATIEENATGGRFLQVQDAAGERGFPATGFPYQSKSIARLYRKIHAGQSSYGVTAPE
jgi:hypothetical protein